MQFRYDPETDMVQIFYSGIWNDWIPVGFQAFDALTLSQNQWDFSASTASYSFKKAADGSVSITAAPKGNQGSVTDCKTVVLIDLTGKNSIKISGRVWLYTTATAQISLRDENGQVLYVYTTKAPGSAWTSFSVNGDISGLSGKAYLRINLPCFSGYATTEIQFTKLLIE